MANDIIERFAVLLEDNCVVFREERVNERMLTIHDSAKYPLENFLERWPDVTIRGYSEEPEINLQKIPVPRLPGQLAVFKDRDLIKQWMMEDPRTTAKQHYLKRLEELGDDSGDAGEAG